MHPIVTWYKEKSDILNSIIAELNDGSTNDNSLKQNNNFSQDSLLNESMFKDKSRNLFTKTVVNYDVPKDVLDNIVKDTKIALRTEINKDMQTRINESILAHPTAVNITQVQKIPETLGDKVSEEIADIKFMVGKISAKADTNEKNLVDYFKRIPVIEQNISTIKAEVLSKASREEFQSIQLVLPNLITRQD